MYVCMYVCKYVCTYVYKSLPRYNIAIYSSVNLSNVPQWLLLRLLALLFGDVESCWNLVLAIDYDWDSDDAVLRYLIES